MYQEIIEKLCCPHCHKPLSLENAKIESDEIISGELLCPCGKKYFIRDGIADFGSHEQNDLNAWSEYYEQNSYEELDKKLENNKSEHQKQIAKQFIKSITNETSTLSDGFLLDVASGRGMLLKELLKTSNPNVHIIATDLSFQVLKYDRIKLCKQNSKIKVSFLACDATKLPIRTDTVDMVCTFVGFVNMGNLAESGIKEAARVMKPKSKLINSCIYLDKDSLGFKNVARILQEDGAGGAEKFFLKDNLLCMHKKYFASVENRILYEGIAENYPDDLIPCEGEWFANALIISQK